MAGRIQRIDLSWTRWNEYKDFRPRRDRGSDWMEYRWAWLRLVITRPARAGGDRRKEGR